MTQVLVSSKASAKYENENIVLDVADRKLAVTLMGKEGDTRPRVVFVVRNEYGGILWSFKAQNFAGMARLVYVGGTPLIALIGRESGGVERVVPLAELIGVNSSARTLLLLKLYAAEMLGCSSVIYDEERPTMAEIFTDRRADEVLLRQALDAPRVAALAKAEEERATRVRERLARSQKLQARTPVSVDKVGFTVHQTGIPCVEGEWECLPDGVRVVLVDSFDEATGKHGEVREHFIVRKGRGQNPKKDACASARLAKAVSKEPPKPLKGLVTFDGDGEKKVRTVVVNPTEDLLMALRRKAPESGLLVARGQGVKGRWPIYQIGKSGPDQPLGRHPVSVSNRV